ncbi:unnamed protein product [Peronospora destructor]|uniref:Uncharacterized protein n=1 Tax=Peronospora destructor TaxID=86335 RepID=A0AAV0UID2_9STRA|nr:unnamed protein product [Peronospora destructor]
MEMIWTAATITRWLKTVDVTRGPGTGLVAAMGVDASLARGSGPIAAMGEDASLVRGIGPIAATISEPEIRSAMLSLRPRN